MHVVIFEGVRWSDFAPICLTKPTFMLPCGASTLLEKQVELLRPSRLSLWVRPGVAEYCRKFVAPKLSVPTTVNNPLDDSPALLTTGRTLHFAHFEIPTEPCVVVEEGGFVRSAYVRSMPGLSPEDALGRSDRWQALGDLPHTMPQGRVVDHLWDLIAWNEEALIADWVRFKGCGAPPSQDGPYHLVHAENVCLAPGAKLGPGCVLDASKGPIIIEKGASIGANAVIEGPCFIGAMTSITPHALIRPGTSIGSVCKVGGEVSGSIISPYTNLAHHGFVGDSFIGSWVNLGANTITSNLKNTYGEVAIQIGEKRIDTGRRRLGALIGDHAKTAIGTRLTTGTYLGAASQLAGSTIAPKFTPSFTFWTDKKSEPYELEKAVDVAKRMMERRELAMDPSEEAIFRAARDSAIEIESASAATTS